jgi:hypothetical protein
MNCCEDYDKYKKLYIELKKYATNAFEIKHLSLSDLDLLNENDKVDFFRILLTSYVEYIYYYGSGPGVDMDLNDYNELTKIQLKYDTTTFKVEDYESVDLFLYEFDIYYNIDELNYLKFDKYMLFLSYISGLIVSEEAHIFYKEYFKYLMNQSIECKIKFAEENYTDFLDTRIYIMSELGLAYLDSEKRKKKYLVYSKNKIDENISGSVIAIHRDSAVECIGIHSTFYHIAERYCTVGYSVDSTHLLLKYIVYNLYNELLPVPGIIYAYALETLSSIIMNKYNFRRIVVVDDQKTKEIYNKQTNMIEEDILDNFDKYMSTEYVVFGNQYILTYRKFIDLHNTLTIT